MDNDRKQAISGLVGEMLNQVMAPIMEDDMPWSDAVLGCMIVAKMLGEIAMSMTTELKTAAPPGFACSVKTEDDMAKRLAELMIEALQIKTVALRMDSEQELDAFIKVQETGVTH